MIRNIITGVWVCSLALGACYAAASYAVGGSSSEDKQPQQLIGLQYKKLQAINVPIIAEGGVKGYVVAQMVFTADAETLHNLSVPADAFVRDEAFRYMYADPRIDFANLSRYNVNQMISDVRDNVNKRLGADVVKEILLEGINFVDKADVRP